jgi:transposase
MPGNLADTSLETKLFPPNPALPDALRPVPDWALIHQELHKKGATLFLLWQEHRAWAGKLDAVMRQEHLAQARNVLSITPATQYR